MLKYLSKIIADSQGNPRSNVFISTLSSISLNIAFLIATAALLFGVPVSDAVVLGLAAIIASLAGHNYRVAKQEKKNESE